MKYPRIYQQVMFEPWHIRSEAMRSIVELLNSRISGEDFKPVQLRQQEEDEDEFDFFGEPIAKMTVNNGIATIPVHGIMIHKASMLDKACGAVGMQDVRDNLKSAAANPEVRAILLDIDSPGGMAMGTPELAASAQLVGEQKPVFAYTDGNMCSAAYYLAASSELIYAVPSADVGSIGTIMAVLDWSRYYEDAGVAVNRFQSGTLKGAGMKGLPITDTEREYFQSKIDEASAMFFNWVRTSRGEGKVAGDVFETGAYYSAEVAAGKGLVDRIHSDVESVRADILTRLEES